MPSRKPNILFFFTDDQRFDTIRALGNPRIHTPNLDRLAEGTAFLNCVSANPICTPARTALCTVCRGGATRAAATWRSHASRSSSGRPGNPWAKPA